MSSSEAQSNSDSVLDPNEPLDQLIMELHVSLAEGGPDVDSALIMAFIDNRLDPDEMMAVKRLIDTYKAWNMNYWELHAASLDYPMPENESPSLPVESQQETRSDISQTLL